MTTRKTPESVEKLRLFLNETGAMLTHEPQFDNETWQLISAMRGPDFDNSSDAKTLTWAIRNAVSGLNKETDLKQLLEQCNKLQAESYPNEKDHFFKHIRQAIYVLAPELKL